MTEQSNAGDCGDRLRAAACGREPNHAASRLTSDLATFGRLARFHLFSSTRIAVVGNDNLRVGNLPPTRKTGQPIVEQMKGSGSSDAGVKQMQAEQPRNCGAMSQQGSFSYHGNVSVPQKLVHLVGCRDPKVRAEPWARPAPKR